MRAPAFQFYCDDFVAGTSILTTEEVGAYILLLCHQWSTGSVPDDERLIRRIAKVTQAFDLGLVVAKFERVDGVLKNRRLEEERQKLEAFRTKQAENGRLGGRPKGLGKPNQTQTLPNPNPGQTQGLSQTEARKSSPSPSPKETILSLGATGEPKGKRVSNLLFDALAEIEGGDSGQLTKSAGGAIGKALSEIRAVCPDVTPEEIRRRAANYQQVMPRGAMISANALAKHWAKCGGASRTADQEMLS